MSLGFVGFSTVPGPNVNGLNQQNAFTAANCAQPSAVRQLVAPPAYSVLHSPSARVTQQQQASFGVTDRTTFRLPFIDVDAVFQNEIANAYQAQDDQHALSMHYLRGAPSNHMTSPGNPNSVNNHMLLANGNSYYGVSPIGMRAGAEGNMAFSHAAQLENAQLANMNVMSSALGNNMVSQNVGRYVCAICGDRATGKHYGVVSCEGCKGFFKRTIRKNLQYACREERHCPIDKRQRNRCQFCRFEKCLTTGMKREAVQEERARAKLRASNLLSTTSASSGSCSFEAPSSASVVTMSTAAATNAAVPNADLRAMLDEFVSESDEEQLHAARIIVGWAKRVRAFADLSIDDRIALLRAGWNELLIATLAHRNALSSQPSRPASEATPERESLMAVDEVKKEPEEEDTLSFGAGIRVSRADAHRAGVGAVFDRVVSEIVEKMRQLAVDRVELQLIRAVILFNPDARGVTRVAEVERARERVYAALEQYCRLRHAADDTRFAKLLLRLPALRSVGLKCVEHLFFFRLFSEAPADSAVRELLTFSNSLSSSVTTTTDADRLLLQSV